MQTGGKAAWRKRIAGIDEVLLGYLREQIVDELTHGVKSFSVDSLITDKDWTAEPISSLVKGFVRKKDKNIEAARNRVRIRAGYVLRDTILGSGMNYTAGWYKKKSDPRGKARLYTLED